MLGVAVTVTSIPSSYTPPPVTVPPPDGVAVAVSVQVRTKRATKTRLPFTVKPHGVLVPQPPDQAWKR